MSGALLPITSLLLSVAILLTGHGIQLTLLPLRAESIGFSATEIGITGSVYFLGFVIGCLTVPAIITRVGHIRTFAVLAAAATSVLLVIEMTDRVGQWLALRFVTGWALCGLYMVIESWLNEKAPSHVRGGVLAFYTMITLVAISGAQFIIPLAPIGDATLFMLGAVLLCASIIPVGLTRSIAPHAVHGVRFRPIRLFRTSQVAAVSVLLGGMITGAFWALGPLYAGRRGFSIEAVSSYMSAVIIGGALFQLPVGRLSDRFDRRKVILGLAAFGASVCTFGALLGAEDERTLFVVGFLFGGAAMPLYALCVAHANDQIAERDFVEVASGLLMMNSIGSVLGPTIAAWLMTAAPPGALPGYFALCFMLAAGWTLYRLRSHAVTREHYQPFVNLPDTTQSAIDMDPRGEAKEETDGAVARVSSRPPNGSYS